MNLVSEESLGLPEGEETSGPQIQAVVHPWSNHGSSLWKWEDQDGIGIPEEASHLLQWFLFLRISRAGHNHRDQEGRDDFSFFGKKNQNIRLTH